MSQPGIKRWRLTAFIAMFVALSMSVFGLAMGTASAAPDAASGVVKTDQAKVRAPVSGTAEGGRHVRGTFTPESFSVVGNTVMATGTVTGRIVGKGKPMEFSKTVTAPVTDAVTGGGAAGGRMAGAAAGSCDILNLVLGPLDLNILGLEVHLNQVLLDIVAVPGAGQLLGNLLCAVAGLLDPVGGLGGVLGGLLTDLQGLLNQILGALGGL
jgi:hypothetical protein